MMIFCLLHKKSSRDGFTRSRLASVGFLLYHTCPQEVKMKTMDIQECWNKYKNCSDERAREQIILHYYYLVRVSVQKTKLPPNFDREDLISAGIVGLIKAVDQYDTTRQVKFETYAIALIRGAILETLRERDPLTRTERAAVRSGTASAEIVAKQERAFPRSLETMLYDEANSILDVLASDEDVFEIVSKKLYHEQISRSLNNLREREKMVMEYYYRFNLSFKKIGSEMKISESRVYQLHQQALGRLRGVLCDLEPSL